MTDIMLAFLFFGSIALGAFAASQPTATPLPPPPKRTKSVTITVTPKPRKRTAPTAKKSTVKSQVDPLHTAAKTTLVTLGYKATEAKQLLSGITANSVEDYVSQAMAKVKI